MVRITYICRQKEQYLTKNKIMKRFLMTICAAVLSLGMFAQDYYYSNESEAEGGDWAIGLGLDLGFGAGATNFGIQVPRLQYYIASRVRAELAFNYFFKNCFYSLQRIRTQRRLFRNNSLNFPALHHIIKFIGRICAHLSRNQRKGKYRKKCRNQKLFH